MRGRALLMAAVSLVGLAALSLSALAAPLSGQNGTTLISDITVTTERTRTYEWTLTKTADRRSLDMFRNDSATVTYTVAATKGAGVERAFLKGTITVTNGGGVATQDLQIIVESSLTPNNAPVLRSATVDLGGKDQLQPGETATYTYSVEVPNPVIGESYKATANITITNHSGEIGSRSGPSPAASAVMTAAIGDVNASVNVDDSFGPTFAFSASGTQTYTRTFRCDEDRGDKVNTATIRQTGQSATATVTVNCFSLSVTTGATTSFTRTWTWSITKGASTTAVTLEPDGAQTQAVEYEVNLASTSADSAWAVRGEIVITNPAPMAAPLSSVTAILPAGPATVTCPGSAAAANLTTCTYERALPSGAATSVTATVTMPNAPSGTTSYTASAGVDFASATITKIDESVTVTDVANGTPSTLGTATGSARYAYRQIVGPYSKCGAYTFANTASFLGSSGARGSASANVAVTVKCYQLRITGDAATSLTRTYAWQIAKSALAPSVALNGIGATTSLGYAVELSSTPTDSAWGARGRVIVDNPAPVAASLSSLTAAAGSAGVSLTCPGTTVGARAAMECTWTAPLASAATTALNATAALADDSAFSAASFSGSAVIDFSGAEVTEIDRTVTVTDTSGATTRTLGPVTGGGRLTYDAPVGPYAKCGPYSVQNTATYTGTRSSGSSSVTTPVSVACYDLGVTGSASTKYTRTFSWTIEKVADRSKLTLAKGATATVGYTVTLAATSQTSGWTASGGIVIANPAPTAATLSSIVATSSSGAAAVTCPSLTVPAGGTLACSWTLTAASGATATLAITAALADSSAYNAASYAGDAALDFSGATVTEVGTTATVTDTSPAGTSSLGTQTAGATSPIRYDLTVGPYSACGNVPFNNTASFTSGTGTGSATAHVTVTVECPPSPTPTPTPTATPTPAPTATPTPTPAPTATPTPTPTPSQPVSTTNCTLTIGYWKTHGAETAKYLPQTLGYETVSQAAAAVNILKKEDSSNGLEKLKAQLLAAKLSIKRGADATAVSSTITQADGQLRQYGAIKWSLIPKAIQAAILSTASTLDKYNNGIIGPGHCP